jgi:hypothetical protein
MLNDRMDDLFPDASGRPPPKIGAAVSFFEQAYDFTAKATFGLAIILMILLMGVVFGATIADEIVRTAVSSTVNHIARGCVLANGTWRDRNGVNCDGPAPGPASSPSPGRSILPPTTGPAR